MNNVFYWGVLIFLVASLMLTGMAIWIAKASADEMSPRGSKAQAQDVAVVPDCPEVPEGRLDHRRTIASRLSTGNLRLSLMCEWYVEQAEPEG